MSKICRLSQNKVQIYGVVIGIGKAYSTNLGINSYNIGGNNKAVNSENKVIFAVRGICKSA